MSAQTQLITPEVDFMVTTETLRTSPNDLELTNNKATVRVNSDNTRVALAVVGSRYKVVDHQNTIRDFANVLVEAGLKADVKHSVYRNGARVYSRFTLQQTVAVPTNNGQMTATPFFTLTNSHDGALKVGFMVGALVNGQPFHLSPKLYDVHVKHLRGLKMEKVLDEVQHALRSFTNEVVPLWSKMTLTRLSLTQAEEMLCKAIKQNIVSKRRAKNVPLGSEVTLWKLYSDVVKNVSAPSKKDSEESSVWRNARANEYFIEELKRLAQ